ncbi:unnamed protein product [Pleuronectes platessa]|uniref:Uncharacterized protein n=1 Tax=Pleuronectes platessa TaxID=8262 RepID=A0A9N7UVM3_PLEPL|nr:unnamed protein product [Pleuronectes platessa]
MRSVSEGALYMWLQFNTLRHQTCREWNLREKGDLQVVETQTSVSWISRLWVKEKGRKEGGEERRRDEKVGRRGEKRGEEGEIGGVRRGEEKRREEQKDRGQEGRRGEEKRRRR